MSSDAPDGWDPPGRPDPSDVRHGTTDLTGHDVTLIYRGDAGRTTITSSVSDISADATEIELAAMPGHLFPRTSVVRIDDIPTIRRPDPGTHPVQREAWRLEDPRRCGPEHRYGRYWTFDDPADLYSIVWNSGTGELYTHRQRDDTILVRAVIADRRQVDALLTDWPAMQLDALSGYVACGIIHAALHPTGTSFFAPGEHQSPPVDVKPPEATAARLTVTDWQRTPPPAPPPPPPTVGIA